MDDLAEGLLARLRARLGDRCVGWTAATIGPLFDTALARVRARWPEAAWDDTTASEALARVLDGTRAPADAFAAIHVDDVLLADACARGDATALAIFERELMPVVDRALGRMQRDSHDELRQRIRAILFVARPSGPPAIASYGGRAPLGGWLRVVATREAAVLAKAEHHVPADDGEIEDMVASALDPELQLAHAAYHAELREAFASAFAKLDPSERTMLRMHLLDRVGIDQLAAMHAVHRATAARWLAKLREQLYDDTRRAMMQRLRLSPSELDSAMRLVRSELDVSIARHLQDE